MSEDKGLRARVESQVPHWERVKRRREEEAATARCSVWDAAIVVGMVGGAVKDEGRALAVHMAVQSLGVNFWPTYYRLREVRYDLLLDD
jgi:hypothetical protein